MVGSWEIQWMQGNRTDGPGSKVDWDLNKRHLFRNFSQMSRIFLSPFLLGMVIKVWEVGASLLLVAQWQRICLPMQETQAQSLGQEDTLEKEMATHPSILACRIPLTEEPGRLEFMGSQRVRHNLATKQQQQIWNWRKTWSFVFLLESCFMYRFPLVHFKYHPQYSLEQSGI